MPVVSDFQKIHAQELETLKAKTRAAFDADGQYYSVTAPAGFTLTSNVHDSIRHELKTYFMRQAFSISVTQRHLTAQASKPSLSNESKIYTTPSGLLFLRTGNTGYTDGYNSQEYSLILHTSELIDMEITQVIPGGETFSTVDMEKVADSLVLKDAKNILLKQQLCIKGDVYYKRACTSLDPF